MTHKLFISALLASLSLTLAACDRPAPTVVTVPGPTVAVPGPVGPQGATGNTGNTGSTGSTGSSGSPGTTGSTGATGMPGTDGVKGEPGKTGDSTTVIITPPPKQ